MRSDQSRKSPRWLLCAPLLLAACSGVVLADSASGKAGQHFSIAAGDLSQQLNQVAKESGVFLVGDSELTAGVEGKALEGTYTAQQALDRLLEGTGLSAQRGVDGTYTLTEEQPAESVGQGSGLENLESMVVTATMSPQSAATVPAFNTVISSDDINNATVNGLADLLGDTVGVNNFSDNLGRDELQLRGLSGDYVLILVDGRRVSSSDALWRGGDFDYSSVPMSSIDRVEVVRGPMSSLYGADAIGGVVNIITKKSSDHWQGTLRGEYRLVQSGEDGDQMRAGISASGPLGESVSLSLSLEQLNRDAWFSDDKGEDVAPRLEEKKALNAVSALSWHINEAQTLKLDVGVNTDERPYGVFSAGPDFREQEITRQTVGMSHLGDWEWGETSVTLSHENAEIDDFNTRYDEPRQRNLIEKNTVFKAYAVTRQGRHGLTAGVDYRDQTVEDDVAYQDTGKLTTNNIAVFGQDQISLTDELSLTLGARLDDHEIYGDHLTPRAYLVYSMDNGVSIKGGVSEGFKAPGAYQLSEEYRIISCGGNCFLSGNPNLDPETSTNYEMGVEVREAAWHLSAAVFKNDVEDMISAVFDEVNVQRNWENIDEVETRGFELEGAVDVHAQFSLSGNLTLQEAEDGDGQTLENRPEQAITVNLDWRPSEQIGTRLSVRHIGEQEVFAWPDYVTLPAFTVMDLGAAYQVNQPLLVRAGIKNLTDVILDEEDENFNTHVLGRNYYLSVSYAF